MLRNDQAFIKAAAQRLVALDLMGNRNVSREERALLTYAARWDIDPIELASAIYCQAMLLKTRITAHEEVTRSDD